MQVSFDPSEVAHFFHIRAFLKTFDSAGVKILVVENIRLTQMCYLIKNNLTKANLTPEGSNVYRINNNNHVSDPRGVACSLYGKICF
mgnify:CR=1 FL=1